MIGRTNTGGGGGGLQDSDALLRVMAPAGSVVTITKGSLTKTDHGHENALDPATYDYYFIIHQSQFDSTPWTVTATLGTKTKSTSITINAPDEYDVTLAFEQYYYYLGDQYTAITGGYGRVEAYGTFTAGDDYMSYESNAANTERWAASVEKVDLTNYSTLYFSAKSTSGAAKRCGVASSRGGNPVVQANIPSGSSYAWVSMDISSLSGSYYIQFSSASTGTARAYVNQIYAK